MQCKLNLFSTRHTSHVTRHTLNSLLLIAVIFFGISCQKDLVLNSQAHQFSTGNQFLKSETLANGIHKKTLKNGIQMYQIPQELMRQSPENSPLGCGNNLPSNAQGCCCLDFLYYGDANVGQFTIPYSLVFSEKTFVMPEPAYRALYLKLQTIGQETAFYENILYWADDQPNCNTSSMAVVFPGGFPTCRGDVEITARKLFRNPTDTSFTTCAETIGTFWYRPADPRARCFF